jgi:hypothetical protein
MTRPFKISPRAALRGSALASEVRHTYPLSVRDEHALRAAVRTIVVKRLSRGTVPNKVVRDIDVHRAAVVLGLTTADLRRKLANLGRDTISGQRRLRVASRKTTDSKGKLGSSRRSKDRRRSRPHARIRG